MILENTFTSIEKVVDHVLPVVSLAKALILRNHWPSIERIGSVEAPVLFVSGGKDQLVPPSHMLELKQKAKRAQFVDWKLVEEGDHNNTWNAAGRDYPVWIREFVQRSLSS